MIRLNRVFHKHLLVVWLLLRAPRIPPARRANGVKNGQRSVRAATAGRARSGPVSIPSLTLPARPFDRVGFAEPEASATSVQT
jgi:hypothetical protein